MAGINANIPVSFLGSNLFDPANLDQSLDYLHSWLYHNIIISFNFSHKITKRSLCILNKWFKPTCSSFHFLTLQMWQLNTLSILFTSFNFSVDDLICLLKFAFEISYQRLDTFIRPKAVSIKCCVTWCYDTKESRGQILI